jgi:type IV pilus assembly protein PilC
MESVTMLFTYNAKTRDGKPISGEIEASNETEAVTILREKKLIVLNLKKTVKNIIQNVNIFGISNKDRLLFLEQLAVVLESGMSLVEALETLKDQTSNKELQKILGEISVDVRGGKSFSEALSKYPRAFSDIFVSMVKSGEKSGKLDDTLKKLTEEMEKDYELQAKIKNALMYPVVIFIALIGVLILSLVYVMPQIKKIFEEMDVQLPLLTRIVLGVSDFLASWWWVFVLIIIIFILLRKTLFKSKYWQKRLDVIKLKIPIYGPFLEKMYMERFARNLQTMVTAGISITESLRITKNVLTNVVYQDAMDRIIADVENGLPLATAIKKEKSFPAMASQLIAVGEKSGRIDYVLDTLANFYSREVESTTRNLTTILEPVLTIIMGIAIALFVASVIMPIYGLVNVI